MKIVEGVSRMNNSDKVILHLCAKLGSDTKPYKDAGYTVILVTEEIDVRTFAPPPNVYGIVANPPCTQFSYARTRAKTPRNLRAGMELVQACQRIIYECLYRIKSCHQKYMPLAFWALENPDAMLRWFLGKPALIYNPFDYGEPYQKRTCLWGNFNEPKKAPIQLTFEQKKLAGSNSQPLPKFDQLLDCDIAPEYKEKLNRADRRAICSSAFAQAFYEANK